MSDLAATNCGCGCDDNCGVLLMSCCGNGSTFGGNDGCNDCSCLILILLLLCGCGGNGFC